MNSGLFNGGEDASALNDVFGSGAGPVDVGRVPLAEDDNLGAVDVQEGTIVLHLACGRVVTNYNSVMLSSLPCLEGLGREYHTN